MPQNDPGVDLDDDQDMLDVDDHEAGAKRLAPVGAPILPFSRRGRLNARYRMELGDQISALIVEVGFRPAHYRDIHVDDSLERHAA